MHSDKKSLALMAALWLPTLAWGVDHGHSAPAHGLVTDDFMLSGLQRHAADAPAPVKAASMRAVRIVGVAPDPWYGYSADQPIAVGNAISLQRAYFEQLRGTEGEPLEFRRSTDCAPADDEIACYEVTYLGLGESVTLFLDVSQADAVYAPLGFTYID